MSLPHRHSIPLAELRRMIDQHIGTSRWFTIDQTLIDDFARITQDEQFIHVDPVRAAEAPFGSTIAHGFLTMSYLAPMAYDAVPLADGTVMGVNYGFDKVRFLTPVPAGARIRGHFTLDALEEEPGQVTSHHSVTVEIEDADHPALVAKWISRGYFTPDT
ncbi:MaoC family dehydratase [Pontivivens nitratireducens]|uniref:MaoC family dehydratase n=1 Tax=Pontivivens nitratireducens TaxID=2758038 RepID=A0A6G7VM00_9RHOB|nr:MaoC family dehydratase [Pontibrevibacter nitratireducens]QIK41069.1 MaoC family dehydratase [Pontibrevibacter nitratireducens]